MLLNVLRHFTEKRKKPKQINLDDTFSQVLYIDTPYELDLIIDCELFRSSNNSFKIQVYSLNTLPI